jgi:hypothetical protein
MNDIGTLVSNRADSGGQLATTGTGLTDALLVYPQFLTNSKRFLDMHACGKSSIQVLTAILHLQQGRLKRCRRVGKESGDPAVFELTRFREHEITKRSCLVPLNASPLNASRMVRNQSSTGIDAVLAA